MLWLFITARCVIVGAELNCETERQTQRDITEGDETNIDLRSADAADTVGVNAQSA